MMYIRRNRIPIPHGKRSKAASRCHRSGEWTRAGYRAPACYVTNARPIVRATFSAAPADLSSVTLLAETAAAIGGFAATNVAFAGGAASDVALLTKSATTNCILEVVTNTLGKTDGHVLYTILGEPVEPWNNAFGNKANAWASALDIVCSNGWAKGCTNCDDAASAITKAIFDSGRFQYETNHGAPQLITAKGRFRLSKVIEIINKRQEQEVNCSDCARMTTSFANILGCSLYSSKMRQSFQLNPITAIGRDPWTPPGWGWSFKFHEVAWAGDCLATNHIYDACLLLDGDDSPSTHPHSPMYAVDIQFSDGSPSMPLVYKERLTSPGSNGYDKCYPCPWEKQRVPIQ